MKRKTLKLSPISYATHHELVAQAHGLSNKYKFFKPGMVWYCDWLFSPMKYTNDEYRKQKNLVSHQDKLSFYYWRDWCKRRPPIQLLTPNGKVWGLDQLCHDNEGWEVKGSMPGLTANKPASFDGWVGSLIDGELITRDQPVQFLHNLSLY